MEFSKTGYQALLETALVSGYRFLPFDNTLRLKQGKCCLLRHDVDVDLSAALEIAKVESVLGIINNLCKVYLQYVYYEGGGFD